MAKLRIVFMGTPEFAVPSLELLHDKGYNIVGVVTAPDKPKGRGQLMGRSPVKEFAMAKQLQILQPTNLKDSGFLEELESLGANLQIVVAFRMLPKVVWSMPELGTFNLHASLLPQYRGAAPINWAIINGETETGVSTFFLRQEIDTGAVIFQENESVLPHDNAGSLYQRLMIKGAHLVLVTAQAIENETYDLVTQSEFPDLKPAPKISKADCQVDWDQSVEKINNFIRGLSPYPGAWTLLKSKTLKIFKSALVETRPKEDPGKVISDSKTFLRFSCQNGYLEILDLQLEGKKRMNVLEFLRGNRL
jgi:methionyl-tRNA formyltransferase